jgi:hypothetical protein
LYISTTKTAAKSALVSPSDCGLAVTIPLDRETFAKKLEREEEGNFVQAFRAERSALSVDGLWRLYQPYADLASEIANRVRAFGVSVVLDVSLDQFASLLRSHAVVALVAQWRSALFRASDIQDAHAIFDRLSDPTSPPRQSIQRFGSGARNPESADTEILAEYLNQSLLCDLQIPGANGKEPRLGEITRFQYQIFRRRESLAMETLFRGGAGAEFAEGFHSVNEIVSCFPPEFSGLVDLTVCNSVLLAESIRRAYPDCLVLANEDLAYLDFRLATYAQVIRSLSGQPEPYEDVVYRIRKELQEIGHEAQRRLGAIRIISALWRKIRRPGA